MKYKVGTILRQLSYRRATGGDISIITEDKGKGFYKTLTVRADGHVGCVFSVREDVLDTNYVTIGYTEWFEQMIELAQKTKEVYEIKGGKDE